MRRERRTLRESGRVLNWGNEGFEGEGISKRGKHGEPVGVPEGRVNEGNI